MKLTSLEKQLLNDFQRDFPITSRPFQQIATQLNITEIQVIEIFHFLKEKDFISRIGAVIPPNKIGVSSLIAMAIPETELECVATKISEYCEVNHNYEREHALNLWFVVIAKDNVHLSTILNDIENQTGYKTLSFPLINDFFIDLGFEMTF